ncbi:ImmA/IrrE family metallo-endopeptidase [Lapidilactobacillus achengensis]|uniref:ImmA/IrrE family metallo-endopeptidase n=1 Tax=Lapidilactobacillus achengensis TaxID=2486000 RepID=A0ABW1UQD8_9LACO|nr:ImmA/IrrE family metallo-endopeptidase [Lapidilactobacillus achengensis]
MNAATLKAYFEESGLTVAFMQEKTHQNFPDFLSGAKTPTFNQLIKIAQVLKIPVGLLLLNQPLESRTEQINFRTVNSEHVDQPSKELLDTIAEMRTKQDFLRGEIDTELPYIGRFTSHDNELEVARFIRQTLMISQDYYRYTDKTHIIQYLRERINRSGVFVFFNGKYKDNTHRVLDPHEFRGFVLVDTKAPLIFINQKDSSNGQLFTLVHELVHLFIADEEILGHQSLKHDFDPTEVFVNKVTAEILVPQASFLKQYRQTPEMAALASYFKVSEFVIARRLLDNRQIKQADYDQLIDELTNHYEAFQLTRTTEKTGGNFKNNIRFRIDRQFFNYVQNAINNQQLSYTEAFNIIGVGYKGYHILKERR